MPAVTPAGICSICKKPITPGSGQPRRNQHRKCRSRQKAAHRAGGSALPQVNRVPSFEQDGDTAYATATFATSPPTLEAFLELLQVDLSAWQVDHWLGNNWTLADGSPAYQIKVWFIRAAAAPETPKPIQIIVRRARAQTPSPRRRVAPTGQDVTLVIPDSQNGYSRDLKTGRLDPMHDRRAWDVCVQVAENLRPNKIVLLGDMVDATEFTIKYRRKPEHFFTLQPALRELGWWLGQLRAASPDAEIIYLEGNHERRLWDMAATVAMPYAHLLSPFDENQRLLSVPGMIDLKSLGVTYLGGYPDNIYWLTEHFAFIHGDKTRPKVQPNLDAVLESARFSFMMGHCHRVGESSRTLFDANGAHQYSGYTPGCICRLDGAVPGVNALQNWQQGFGMIRSMRGTGEFDVKLSHIWDGRTLFEGQVLVGEDRVDQIRAETGWETL